MPADGRRRPISPIAVDQPDAQTLDSREVEARLAWLASAGTEDEALLIESALLTQTDNRSHKGDPAPRVRLHAHGAAWFKARRRWRDDPKPGDIVFFNFPGDGVDRISHVGIVESVRPDGSIVTIEATPRARWAYRRQGHAQGPPGRHRRLRHSRPTATGRPA